MSSSRSNGVELVGVLGGEHVPSGLPSRGKIEQGANEEFGGKSEKQEDFDVVPLAVSLARLLAH